MKKLILGSLFCVLSSTGFASSEAICNIHMRSGETVENTYLCCKTDGKNMWLLNKKKCPGDQYSQKCGYETKLKGFKRGSVAEQCRQVIPAKMGFSEFRLLN